MNKRITGMTVPVLITAALAAACSSQPALSPAPARTARPAARAAAITPAPAPQAGIPAGYARDGGPAQGISVAAPSSWTAFDLSRQSIAQAARRTGLTGVSADALIASMRALQRLHAVMIADTAWAAAHPDRFVPNLNAYCVLSGLASTGAAGIPLVRTTAAAQLTRLGATRITQRQVLIGDVPGIQTSYQLTTHHGQIIYASQLEVLPAPGKACFVTVSAGTPRTPASVLAVAGATARYP